MAAVPGEQVSEFTVRVPKREENKKYHVMKFNASLNIDFSKWSQARMVRENNQKIQNSNIPADDDPKFGAGSTFGKDVKEEAKRNKLGIIRKKYNPDAQPWLMRIGGKKDGRKYKGIREGGVSANTTYYVFTHGKDGAFEAFPIHDWYNFTPMMRYKTLDADEAEEKFAQRGKILNKWAVMVNKKLRPGEEGAEDEEEGEGIKTKKGGKKEMKISDMDDWAGESDDGLDTDEDEKEKKKESDSDEDNKKGKRGKDTKKKKKKKKTDVDEAFEDSDDGDDEGREVDYMSDESSDSDEEMDKDHDIKGVDQEDGIGKMLDSDSSSEDEKKKSDEDDDDEDETGKKKKKKPGSDDDEGKGKKGKKSGSAGSSRSATPTKEMEKSERGEKRKALVAGLLDPNAATAGESSKKSRLEQFGTAAGSGASSSDTISEEDVRRYLKRRPMTTTDLLKKFRSKTKNEKINNAHLVQLLANILKKINPHKQKVKGTVYLSMKEGQ